jgi:hypothetical protein
VAATDRPRTSPCADRTRSCVARRAALVVLALALAFAAPASAQVVTGHARVLVRHWSDKRLSHSANALQFNADALSFDATANPSTNRTVSAATWAACSPDPDGPTCIASALADINAARAAEGVQPMELPSDFASLTMPQQLLVVTNLERVNRGLTPVSGLASSLDAVAGAAAADDSDPMPTKLNGNVATSNWAAGTGSSLVADFLWMYDDGPGSSNVDCANAGDPGCWGHRHDILYPFSGPIAMGAGYARSTTYGPSITELFIGGDQATGPGQADALIAPTWWTLAQPLMVGLSATSVRLSGGAQAAAIHLSSSGQQITVRASVTSGAGAWHVSQPGCTLVPGSGCNLTISVSPAGVGSSGTLTLSGPAGDRTVQLASQGSAALTIKTNRSRIRPGRSVTVKGHLRDTLGQGIAGQLVTLVRQTRAGTRTVARRRTAAGGAVAFHVSPRDNAHYSLVFGGSAQLTATSTGSVSVRVLAPHRRRAHR